MSNEDHAAPFVSVIVPHYNDLDNLAVCLERLRRQGWPRERFEIIVADNNSAGGIEAVRRLAPDLRVVPAPLQGAGPARNEAVAVARGEVLAFIDSDCVAEPGWLAAGVAALWRFDYVGGQVVTALSGHAPVTPAEGYEAVFAFNFKKYIEKDKFSGSGNLFVPRDVFAAVGGFRNGVSEDIDWCRRANALGYRLGYAEDAIVRHAARRDWAALARKWDRVVAERFQLASERAGWRWRWLAYAALVAASPLPHSLLVLRSRNLPGARAKLMALIGLYGIRLYRAGRMAAYLAKPSCQVAERAGN
jgi:glycosyltransferase involved in cell wall biosynthesis